MIDYRTAHTADVPGSVLDRAQALLMEAFDGDFGDDDWEHSLGGLHVIAGDGDEVVGHAAVVQRRLMTGGRAWRTGYVEGVGVRPDRQREGIGGELMSVVERIIRGDDLGALGATDEGVPLYTKHGWRPWRGPLLALTPTGPVAAEEEKGYVYVLTDDLDPLDPSAELMCDWRDGDVW